MRQNEKAIAGLCVAVLVVAAFVVLRGYGGKSETEEPPGTKPRPRAAEPATAPVVPPAPVAIGEATGPAGGAPRELVGVPAGWLDSKAYPVDEKYDASHDVMTFDVTNLKTEDPRFTLVAVRWMAAGEAPVAPPTSVHFTFSTKGAARKFDESDDVSMVADGKALIPSSAKIQKSSAGGAVLEYVSLTLATQDFLDFANAKTEARVKVGAIEFGIGAEERMAMRALASRFPKTAK